MPCSQVSRQFTFFDETRMIESASRLGSYRNWRRLKPSGVTIRGGYGLGWTIAMVAAIFATWPPVARAQHDWGLAEWVTQVSADLETLDHRYRVPLDEAAHELRAQVLRNWLVRLKQADFAALSRAAQIDYLLLRAELEYRLQQLELERKRQRSAAALLPYHSPLVDLLKAREEAEQPQAESLAGTLDEIAATAERLVKQLHKTNGDDLVNTPQRLDGLRAAELLQAFQRQLTDMDRFYNGYDPDYSWWCRQPMERLTKALAAHRKAIRERIVGVAEEDDDTIIGQPIGREGLAIELRHEWIAHHPEELIALAEREMQWCEQQMLAATRQMGLGEDWRSALQQVKEHHVPPGEQPQLIRELAWEAIRFLEAHDLITVPPLAANGWRVNMMSPDRQRLNPYFLGGDSIIVSYPTDTMTHAEKLMSMRSNNVHFARATVHHELIPGHHLQYYALRRYRPYRELFGTPFWMEGWALYWEMLLWDLDFARGPEDRMGMLFWRKHRCARIIFSLNYHLGNMTPEQCVQFLIDQVGHEPSAAAAEVRRSIMGGYGPLYQAAYMLGGLQLRKLHDELVLHGRMTNRQFHDAVLREHSIPIEVLRMAMTGQPLSADLQPSWRFAAPEDHQ
ncbi:MAG: X-Pro dipeptidyl-peptidase [Pirellulaceae bacterium]|nr:MAG: X-Pro dipeptidyl-peptidase [Pirellulaceae bacterium]